jgi:hypothetical protein
MSQINNKIPKRVVNKFKNNKENSNKLDRMNSFLQNSLQSMKNRQNKLMVKHNFGEKENKFLLYPEKNAFYMYNSKTNQIFFKAKFQIIGTYSEKSKTWRWGWSNRYVPHELKATSLKIKKFGEANKVELLTQPKIKDENMGLIFTALGMKLSNSSGYYIVPGTKVYPSIYIIFTKVEKVDLDYTEITKQMRVNTRKSSNVLRSKLELGKISKRIIKTLPKSSEKPKVKKVVSKSKSLKKVVSKSKDKKVVRKTKPKPKKSPKKKVVSKSRAKKKVVSKSRAKKSLTKKSLTKKSISNNTRNTRKIGIKKDKIIVSKENNLINNIDNGKLVKVLRLEPKTNKSSVSKKSSIASSSLNGIWKSVKNSLTLK